MTHDPDSELRDDEARLQELFDQTAPVASSDQVDRWLAHARRTGEHARARQGARSWLRRWLPALVPAAAALGATLWIEGARGPGRTPEVPSAPRAVSGISSSAPPSTSARARAPSPTETAAPQTDEADEPDDSWTIVDPADEQDWGPIDDLELLHPPEGAKAQRAWLQAMDDDLAGSGGGRQ